MIFPGNVMAHVHVSWLEPCKVRRVTVVGDEKMAVYNDVSAEEKIKVYDRGVTYPEPTDTFGEFQLSYRYGDIVSPHVAWHEPLRSECSHFADCSRLGEKPYTDGRSGLRVVRILEAIDTSLELGGRYVNVADECSDTDVFTDARTGTVGAAAS
jgi:predicted dehydrogenase